MPLDELKSAEEALLRRLHDVLEAAGEVASRSNAFCLWGVLKDLCREAAVIAEDGELLHALRPDQA